MDLTFFFNAKRWKMEYFFVYGTLKRGKGNHDILGKSLLVDAKALTLDNYTLYNLGCPGAVRNPKGKPVLGELYEVYDLLTIDRLDALEGNGHFYTRYKRPIKANWANNNKIDAWIYELPDTKWGMAGYCPIDEATGAYYWK